jgi:hypothetical protein
MVTVSLSPVKLDPKVSDEKLTVAPDATLMTRPSAPAPAPSIWIEVPVSSAPANVADAPAALMTMV